MKKGVMLINTSRGRLINTLDVTEGLKSGQIGYLGLDVYEEERGLFFEDHSSDIVQDDVISRLITFANVLITSHQAFLTDTALKNIAATTMYNLDCFVKGEKGVNELGMEVCCTLGMLTEEQAQKLADAGLYAYNHNLDTSGEYYEAIITTRTYDDRLRTLDNVRKAGVSVCCGGIIGLGESHDDRVGMLHTLSNLPKHPDSVPINALTRVKGTPLENMPKVAFWDMVRMIATTRLIMPKAMVRLSAGRAEMSISEQALCFLAGANSIFTGEKLLTTDNPSFEEDHLMFELLGLKAREAFKDEVVSMDIVY